MPLSPAQFVERWRIASLSERASSQSHFLDLCEMLDEQHPAAADAVGERFTFEKRVSKTSGGKGFADVWLRDHFAWEYKGKLKDLNAAYLQLLDYREDLLNPPLLVVCDLNRFDIHTNFGKTKKRVYQFDLRDLERNQPTADCPLPPLEVLRALFSDTDRLRPERTDAFVTQEAAKVFARLAERLEIEKRALTQSPIATRQEIAHFLLRLLFCLFADNIGLLPKHVFRRLIDSDDRFIPRIFLRKLKNLFEAMAEPDGIFGEHTIKYFNGGLFDSSSVIELDKTDLGILHEVATRYDWSHVAPAIFGTLFERSLDTARRSLIGAHYTSEEDILLLIEPVVVQPLRDRWDQTKASILTILDRHHPGAPSSPTASSSVRVGIGEADRLPLPVQKSQPKTPSLLHSYPEAEQLLAGFFDHLAQIRILDPACGSGNFLYVALRKLLDLWLEARDFAIHHNIQLAIQYAADHIPSPTQLFGIEVEEYAHQLASVVVWIGFLQWKIEHGILIETQPILQKLPNIEHDDAILRYDKQTNQPYEPTWAPADFIVGNPPFLGDKKMRSELDIAPHPTYTNDLRALYKDRVPGGADLVTFWFEKAREQIELDRAKRAGLLATQAIRGGANRFVLSRIKASGNIFWAVSDKAWVLDGANVHISAIAFDNGTHGQVVLNGASVRSINADLTADTDTTQALVLSENQNICFIGTQKSGDFDIDSATAAKMLRAPVNVNGKPNSDVIHPWVNGIDITRRPRNMYIIDFGTDMPLGEACQYQMPFEYVKERVRPQRMGLRRENHARLWWLHAEARPGLRKSLLGLQRYIATPRLTKYRIFVFLPVDVIPDSQVFAIARDDDYFFGTLHSVVHETWALTMGTHLEDRPRYTPNSTFDTFPFPYPPGTEPSEAESPIVRAIAEAARELVRLRDNWLNPPNASEEDLKSRTLTKLYNERPTWLDNAHRALDRAVFAAYGWPYPLSNQEILTRLLALNHQRAAAQPPKDTPTKPARSKPKTARTPKNPPMQDTTSVVP